MGIRCNYEDELLRKPICGNCREIAISATVMGAGERERDRRRYGRVRKEERDLVKMRSLR